ncbi:MAG: aminotransferase class I/II-fold pyridoxal phosphate-dependent enzyme [Gammaproteobacteria bacterium]
MGIKPSHRVQSVKSSSLTGLRARAAERLHAGREIIDLSRAALAPITLDGGAATPLTAAAAVDDPAGSPTLRAAISVKFERDNALRFPPAQILVSHDARHAVHALLQALLNDDDEVIIPAPYWHACPDLVRLAGGEPVIVRTSAREGWRMTPEQLRGALGPRTRLVILASLAGPTGACYPRGELEALAAVLAPHPETVILCDDVHEHAAWGEAPFVNLLNAAPRLHERCVVVNAIPGGGPGYAAGAAPLIAATTRYQAHSLGGPSAPVQTQATAALGLVTERRDAWHTVLRAGHACVLAALARVPGASTRAGAGGCHLLADLRAVIARRGDIDDDVALAHWLLDAHDLVCVPGSACGAPGHLRVTFALPATTLYEAARRLECALR